MNIKQNMNFLGFPKSIGCQKYVNIPKKEVMGTIENIRVSKSKGYVLIAEKAGFLSSMIMENLINFLKKKFFMIFFSKNDFDLLSVLKSDTRML